MMLQPVIFLFLAILHRSLSLEADSIDRQNNINSVLTYTPNRGWINDPNGLVYLDGTYHLFYQHNSYGDQAGNISWGHATGKDLVSWEDKGTGLPFNEVTREHIFSGSAVFDQENTSGLGTADNPPLVAAFTGYYPQEITLNDGTKIREGTQAQSIAYSTDKGANWQFYENNPVIRTPPQKYSRQYKSFRDPKVFWYEPQKKWVMITVLAALRKATIFSSTDLKNWNFESEFSSKDSPIGEWECPDLFELPVEGERKGRWVFLLSTNPGGLWGGSGMHYFIGQFNGIKFTPDADQIQHFEYGSDFYAGVTWNNAPHRRYLIGWVNNWLYSMKINNEYKGGLSFVRELSLKRINGQIRLSQKPVDALKNYRLREDKYDLHSAEEGIEIDRNQAYEFSIELIGAHEQDYSIVIEDDQKNLEAEIMYNRKRRMIVLQKKSMNPDDNGKLVKHTARFDPENEENIRIFIDNNTLTVLTSKGDIGFTELLISRANKRKLHVKSGSILTRVGATRWILAKP